MTRLFQSAIQRILPHRYPFLLVDRVTEFVPAERIAAVKHFSANDIVAQGHSPGAPCVPFGIVMEMATQLGAILVLERPQMAGKIAVILGIPSARILKPVRPGDTVHVETKVVKLRERYGELEATGTCNGDLIAEGQMRFAVADAADLLPQ